MAPWSKGQSQETGGQYFVAPDGKAYVCDTPGMAGVKERREFEAEMHARLTAQQTLL